jgi:hypothetical protein
MAQISHYPILQAVLAEDYVKFTDLWMSNRLRPKPHKAHYLRREGGRSSVTLFPTTVYAACCPGSSIIPHWCLRRLR